MKARPPGGSRGSCLSLELCVSGLGQGGPVREWPELGGSGGGARGQGSCQGGVLKYKLSLQTVQLF